MDQTADLLVNSLYNVGLHVVESGIEIRQKHMKTSIPSELHCSLLVWNTGIDISQPVLRFFLNAIACKPANGI